MTDLTEFLLARLDEDEAAARTALEDPIAPWSMQDWIEIDDTSLTHVRRHDPHRVLAEVEAKRRIVGLHARRVVEVYDAPSEESCNSCGTPSEYPIAWPCPTLRALALPYADHPDYRQEWLLLCPHREPIGAPWQVAGDFAPCECCGGPVSVLGIPRIPFRCSSCTT